MTISKQQGNNKNLWRQRFILGDVSIFCSINARERERERERERDRGRERFCVQTLPKFCFCLCCDCQKQKKKGPIIMSCFEKKRAINVRFPGNLAKIIYKNLQGIPLGRTSK